MADCGDASILVHVRLFAMQRELAGTRGLDLSLPAGPIEDAWTEVVQPHPALAPGRPALRFARNGAYAPPETTLADGDEVAMIPPVSGGSDAAADPGDRDRRVRDGDPGRAGERLATPEDGAVVGFLGGLAARRGRPRRGRRQRPPGTPAALSSR